MLGLLLLMLSWGLILYPRRAMSRKMEALSKNQHGEKTRESCSDCQALGGKWLTHKDIKRGCQHDMC